MQLLIKKTVNAVIELIYPRGLACALCGADLDVPGNVLCSECAVKMPPIEGVLCPGCGRSCTGEERLYRMCRQYGPVSDGGFAAHDYVDTARGLMIAYKFHDRTGLRELFVHGMLQAVQGGGIAHEIDCVVPVPMHWRRKFYRGYNQSELLASWVAEGLGCPLVQGVLARPVYTRAAARMAGGPAGRMENAMKSYRPGHGSLEGKTVLLVDDILTTGATLRACVAILRRMGANKVYSVVATAVPE
jgi:ComF family protein